MADDIRALDGDAKIATFSYFDAEETSGDERPFISAISGRKG
jgi:hypothetical protein